MSDDDVVLLDETGRPTGTAPKAEVHGTDTPLHLAFSCYVFDGVGRLLITRRALTKRTWAGVWSNSFCGHPRPHEPLADAVRRHALHELDLTLASVKVALPVFRYRATDASGVVENEICPVYTSLAASRIHPNPEEIMEYCWVEPADLRESVRLTPSVFSPWLVEQAALLPELNEPGES